MIRGALQRRAIIQDDIEISYLVKGVDGPSTVFLHGLGADAAATRPLAGGVAGRAVLIDLPSHGLSDDLTAPTSLDRLVTMVRAVAAREEATRALGVSLGSAVLLRWLTTHDDLERAVAYLPASVVRPRDVGLLRAALSGTPTDLDRYVERELPADVRSTTLARSWQADRTRALRRPGVSRYADLLESEAPVLDPAAAAAGRARLLSIGARGDRVHPWAAAEEAGQLFAHGTSHVFDDAAPLWTARRKLRALISGFLAASDTVVT